MNSSKKPELLTNPTLSKRLLPFFLFGLLIVGAWLFLTILPELDSFAQEARESPWREKILAYGLFSPLVSIGIITAQIFPLPIPGPTIPIINGWLYGFWGGAFVTWLGLMCKGIIGYLLGLGGLKIKIIQSRQDWLIERFKPYLERYGWQAVFVASMIPLFPFTPISSGAALIGMPYSVYLLSRGFGIAPLVLFYAFIGTLLN